MLTRLTVGDWQRSPPLVADSLNWQSRSCRPESLLSWGIATGHARPAETSPSAKNAEHACRP